ncbi:type II secretion system F family protein [Symbiopectobacterium sp.]|uniref:type II secretion system F family protein n=1 Tax=Symbiopectobacterium sp. TaxID=2952789 RepID=UPI003F6823B3
MVKKRIFVKRLKSILKDLPFIIDIMAVCIQSGMTVEKSMRYISDKTKHVNKDIAKILERVILKAEVSGINAALEQLYQEIASNEMRMFCTTEQHSINYGSSIYKMLIALGKEMRYTVTRYGRKSGKLICQNDHADDWLYYVSIVGNNCRTRFDRDHGIIGKLVHVLLSLSVFFLAKCVTKSGNHNAIDEEQKEFPLTKMNDFQGLIKLYREKLNRKEDKKTQYILANHCHSAMDYKSSRHYLAPLLVDNPDEDILLLEGKNLLEQGHIAEALDRVRAALNKTLKMGKY